MGPYNTKIIGSLVIITLYLLTRFLVGQADSQNDHGQTRTNVQKPAYQKDHQFHLSDGLYINPSDHLGHKTFGASGLRRLRADCGRGGHVRAMVRQSTTACKLMATAIQKTL